VLAGMGLSVLMVVESGQTRADAARLMQEALERARAQVIGVALNKASVHVPYYRHYRRGSPERSSNGRVVRLARK
jgi:Mrp family chromosome partitioning ATPase